MRHYLAIAGRFGLLAAVLLSVVLLALIVGAAAVAWRE
jgi:NADH:ubiquinone oxidoreductase subunit 6 (subunit J)